MHDLTGETLGPYRVTERLGRGGMAVVYKAYQASLDRYVAIKVLSDSFTGEEGFLERFQREAQAVARLTHPHIVSVFDFGEDRSLAYMVMEYLDGDTLKHVYTESPEEVDRFRVLTDVADALGFAHEQGIIHRDIKPSNIMVTRQGRVVLTDFGIAKMMGRTQLTATGVGVGTPEYMSPEQGRGEDVDGRSDLYSLGVVAYELFTGRVPYAADTPVAVIYRHLHDPLPLPSQVNPDLPPEAERFLLKALAKDPAERFQTAAEFQAALAGLEAVIRSHGDLSQKWRLPQRPTPVVLPPHRSKGWIWGGAGAGAALLLAGGVFVATGLGASGHPHITVTPASGAPTARFLLQANHMASNEPFSITLIRPTGQKTVYSFPSLRTNAQGAKDVVLFSGISPPPGQYFLYVTGNQDGQSNSVSFRVLASGLRG